MTESGAKTHALGAEIGRYLSALSFLQPENVRPSEWTTHAPFGAWLIGASRPRMVVELGAYYGFSYFIFCQAAHASRLDTKCVAIDTWRGDEQSGWYGEVVYESARAHNERYAEFSSLIRLSFDEAADVFEPESIDLLHIDGCHGYDDVKHDFETWLPLLSDRAVVLFHDTQERSETYGVWRLWSELTEQFRGFEFVHGHGLGVLAVGEDVPALISELTSLSHDSDEAERVRTVYASLGRSLSQMVSYASSAADLDARVGELELHVARFEQLLAAAEETARSAQAERNQASLEVYRLGWQNGQLRGALEEARSTLAAITSNRTWRWTAPVRSFSARHPRLRRSVGRLARLTRSGQRTRASRAANDYATWLSLYDTLNESDRREISGALAKLDYRPTISVLMPVCDPPEAFLEAAIASVRSQLYADWELCLVDDASTDASVVRLLSETANGDPRIRLVSRDERGGISEALNTGLSHATGDFIAFLDHDDVLSNDALATIAFAIDRHPDTALLYSDEDALDELGERVDPYFKPDWNPELLLGQNYLCHFLVCSRALLAESGGLRPEFDGAQDWDLVLRLTAALAPDRVVHIPHVLYHWRRHPGSTAAGVKAKPYAISAGRRAVEGALSARGTRADVTSLPNGWNLVRHDVPDPAPTVDIVVPTAFAHPHVELCLAGLLQRTTYRDVRLVVVAHRENLSRPEAAPVVGLLDNDPRCRVLAYDREPFNYSWAINAGVREGEGAVLCLLNDDVIVTSADWLDVLVGTVMQPAVGAAGAMLYRPDETIQHAGVVLGARDVAGHYHEGVPRGAPGYHGRTLLAQDFSCVTAACMVVRREAFAEVGGFDEELAISFNDVDFCLRLRRAGWRIVWTPLAELYHAESTSVRQIPGRVAQYLDETQLMRSRWRDVLAADPSYNPNLSLVHLNGLASPPRVSTPWALEIDAAKPKTSRR